MSKMLSVQVVEIFIKATKEIFEEALNAKVELSRPTAKPSPMPSHGIAVFVGLTGNLNGILVLDMTRKTAVEVASAMFGEELSGFGTDARSAIMELANMIAGRATVHLVHAGFTADISPPTLVSGSELELYSPQNLPTLVIPMNSQYGQIDLNLGFREEK